MSSYWLSRLLNCTTALALGAELRWVVCRVTEQAKVVESKVGLKRRMQNLTDDVQRKAPMVTLTLCYASS